jgi:hypothetical protein
LAVDGNTDLRSVHRRIKILQLLRLSALHTLGMMDAPTTLSKSVPHSR